MSVLGAILAGGNARRFGSDKALALYKGERMIDCVAAALSAQCDAVMVCGREEEGFTCLQDRPQEGLGPLGGLNAALQYAKANGYAQVLSAGVDAPNLPHTILETLRGEGPAIVQSQPVVGLWPAVLADDLDTYLAQKRRALYGFAESVNARLVAFDPPLMNVNQISDLGQKP